MVNFEKQQIEKIRSCLKKLKEFSENLNERYSQSISVQYGTKQIQKILDHLDKDTQETQIKGEIHSLFRGYENIFQEFETALEFNQLMDDLYVSIER